VHEDSRDEARRTSASGVSGAIVAIAVMAILATSLVVDYLGPVALSLLAGAALALLADATARGNDR
jgi:hypothetical protein